MLFFLITCLSFVFFYKSLPQKPLPRWAYEMRLLSFWFWKQLTFLDISKSIKGSLYSSKMTTKKTTTTLNSKLENVEAAIREEISILDLPDLALDSILERLPPEGLCNMAGVCSALRERCRSDRLWERHMKQKWGRIIGSAAYREWKCHLASRKDCGILRSSQSGGLMRCLSRLWPLSLITSNFDIIGMGKGESPKPFDSIMSWYLALETGKFWFPAQVYNRENGLVGFMLSCYDAELCYDARTDTFQARYPPHGRRPPAIEDGVTWDRLRAPPVDTSPHDLHISDCSNQLYPGDHIEIQWRRKKEFPYGWWYGTVGHLELCDGSESYCLCHKSDTVVLEFNHYTPGSRWRQTFINRRGHREEGNEADGFYGGIRKLYIEDEISTWRRLWPAEVLE
ncbi:hypothetical protein NMG60_11033576 [Bertholletia excelsa]